MDNKLKNQDKKNNQPKAALPFHQRFNIKVQDKEAKQRFLNRIKNRVADGFFSWIEEEEEGEETKDDVMWKVANVLGETFSYSYDLDGYVRGDFYACLHALEIVYQELPKDDQKKELDEIIQTIITETETDLGIRWIDGIFLPSGAKLLDEALVNENLKWLSDVGYGNVLAPFEKGLRHFLKAHRQPERLADTVTDMYEALEALAKVVTGKDRDLSGNAEAFISELKLSVYYKKMLKDYIQYANEFRHAVEKGRKRVPPLPQEVEAFIYTTGLFVRLAIRQLNTQ